MTQDTAWLQAARPSSPRKGMWSAHCFTPQKFLSQEGRIPSRHAHGPCLLPPGYVALAAASIYWLPRVSGQCACHAPSLTPGLIRLGGRRGGDIGDLSHTPSPSFLLDSVPGPTDTLLTRVYRAHFCPGYPSPLPDALYLCAPSGVPRLRVAHCGTCLGVMQA